MKIQDIIERIDVTRSYIPDELNRRMVLSLCHNSAHACPTCAFICKKGAVTDGHTYAYSAYLNGARIFIAERELDLPSDAAVIITPDSASALQRLAVDFYGDPSKKLRLVGITGTKGKTTVAISLYNISSALGLKCGYIGTNGIYYDGKELQTANTTPDVVQLQETLSDMVECGVSTVFIEVSSQALWQERIYGLTFETCVFTNLYTDHIGGVEHPTFEHYRDCKRLLFTKYCGKNIVLNADSEYAEYMAAGAKDKSIITVSAKGDKNCDIYANNAMKLKRNALPGVAFDCHIKDVRGKTDVFIPMPGIYNVENVLLVIAVCRTLGLKDSDVVKQLSTLSVSGRFETVKLDCRPDSLFIIDYAHNGASLTAVLKSLREYEPKRIICLFGSVGGRTFGRRRELGEAAREHADVLIITSDNPNREDPMSVINEINAAVGEVDKPVYLIPDRKDAIEKAVEIARAGDYVLLAGKGHENYQLIDGVRMEFSERRVLKLADALFSVHQIN